MEQTMTGVAGGMALCGKSVFTYSIANFTVTRCLEQIRNDICYHDNDVTIVALGGGLAYGPLGYSHQGIEDIAFMRSLPNMTIYSPADRIELEFCMHKISEKKGPKYLRLARGGEPDLYPEHADKIKDLTEIFSAKAVTFVATGVILQEVLLAKEILEEKGIEVGIFSLSVFSQMALDKLIQLAQVSNIIITVEEHAAEGGLGSFVAEIVASNACCTQVFRKGIAPSALNCVGDQAYLRKQSSIDAKSLCSFVCNLCK